MHLEGEIEFASGKIDIALLDHDDLPRGSEGPTTYSEYGDTISIDGALRDRGWRSDIDGVRAWFQRIVTSPWVIKAHVEIKTLGFFVAGLYYGAGGSLTEIYIPPGFVDLEDEVWLW